MSMEETAVLLSIRPEWCQKIFRGEKTMEIRKSFPKDFQGQPFKCFIYCTKGQNAGFRLEPDGGLLRLDGTVIGEFTCDRVYEIAPLNHAPDDLEAQACMDRDQIWEYTHGKGYAWHITALKTYKTPLDLAAFHLRCENALRWCNSGGVENEESWTDEIAAGTMPCSLTDPRKAGAMWLAQASATRSSRNR